MSNADELHQAVETEIRILNQIISELQQRVSVPIHGQVGGKAERLFCKLAHQVVRGEVTEKLECQQLDHGQCGLTGHQHRCLLYDPNDLITKLGFVLSQQRDALSEMQRIRNEVKRES